VAASTLFRSGSPLPAIEAVHRSVITLAGSAAAIVAGLICLAAAFWLRPRRGPAAVGRSEQLAEP
jgi:predicted membrane protein